MDVLIILISIIVAIIVYATLAIRKLSEPYRLPVFVGLGALLFTPSLVPFLYVWVPLPFGFVLFECVVGGFQGFQEVVMVIVHLWVWYVVAFPVTGYLVYLVGCKVLFNNSERAQRTRRLRFPRSPRPPRRP